MSDKRRQTRVNVEEGRGTIVQHTGGVRSKLIIRVEEQRILTSLWNLMALILSCLHWRDMNRKQWINGIK